MNTTDNLFVKLFSLNWVSQFPVQGNGHKSQETTLADFFQALKNVYIERKRDTLTPTEAFLVENDYLSGLPFELLHRCENPDDLVILLIAYMNGDVNREGMLKNILQSKETFYLWRHAE